MDYKMLNSLALAYMGDAIYEVYVREYLIKNNIVKVKDLQKESIKYVSAKNQAEILKNMIDNKLLTDEEIDVVYRARNHKSHSSKNTDIITYKYSTGLEALIGYLYFSEQKDRINDIMNYILRQRSE